MTQYVPHSLVLALTLFMGNCTSAMQNLVDSSIEPNGRQDEACQDENDGIGASSNISSPFDQDSHSTVFNFGSPIIEHGNDYHPSTILPDDLELSFITSLSGSTSSSEQNRNLSSLDDIFDRCLSPMIFHFGSIITQNENDYLGADPGFSSPFDQDSHFTVVRSGSVIIEDGNGHLPLTILPNDPGPGLDHDQNAMPASSTGQALNNVTRSTGSTLSVDRGLAQAASESVAAAGYQHIERQLRRKQRKRSHSLTPDEGEHKRRRVESPHPRRRRAESSTVVNGTPMEEKRLWECGSDPFNWSVECVLFALTSPLSMDFDPPIDLPSTQRDKLVDFISRHRIDGYSLLLCTDHNAMRNYGITEPVHHRALGEYIVRFRFHSEGYNLYCRKNKLPKNFSAELLIDAAQTGGLVERTMTQLRVAMKRVRVEERTVYLLHLPVGCIEVVKGEDGRLNFSLQITTS